MKPTRRACRRKQTRRRRKGGKKLGEGVYGFVVDPAIACVGKDTSGYVSKVFSPKVTHYTGTAESLLKKAKENPVFAKLKEIDPEQKEFIYAEFCDTPGELSEENKADGVTEENKKFGYLMKRGGRSLEEEFKEKAIESLPDMATVMEQGIDANPPSAYKLILQETLKYLEPKVKSSVTYLKPIVNEVLRLRDKLCDNGILQNDLHPGNVLRMDDGTLRIIDFDIATTFDPKNPPRKHFEDLQFEDQAFIESCAWAMVLKDADKEGTYLDILRSNLAQKITDELSA